MHEYTDIEYIDRKALLEDIESCVVCTVRTDKHPDYPEMRGINKVIDRIKQAPELCPSCTSCKSQLAASIGDTVYILYLVDRATSKYIIVLDEITEIWTESGDMYISCKILNYHRWKISYNAFLSSADANSALERRCYNKRRNSMKQTVVFDFDGVIHSYTSGWQGVDNIPDPVTVGIKEAIEQIRSTGYEVKVVSTRCATPSGLAAVKEYLADNEIAVDDVLAEKPPAIVYIDDRAICFNGDTSTLLEQIQTFKPWYQK